MGPDTAARTPPLFRSFFMGGFESSSHKRRDGLRLDLLRTTEHDVRAEADYRLLAAHGMRAARDGLRWHRIEERPDRYDWSSFLPMLRAANATGTQVVWDLLHYGYPNGLDPWSPRFVERFGKFAGAVARLVRDESDDVPFYTPVNEMSFWAWGGGDVGALNPFATGRGGEFKRILVRCAIAAIEAVRAVDPRARFMTAEPMIHVFPKSDAAEHVDGAAGYSEYQYEATDLLTGRKSPELGGREDYLDIVGVNYYYNNQWIDGGRTVYLGDWLHVPLRDLLARWHRRYDRPMLLAETGTEGVFRSGWLHYVGQEVGEALAAGVPLHGVCLYPVLNHLGWDDDRHCPNGLFDGIAADGARTVYEPMAAELARLRERLT